MKKITFTVPCYNSQDYMRCCIDSLLCGGDEVEIIIVDDGSTDKTGEIADEYLLRYPSIIRVIHKKNGGHGSGVNAGLEHATGEYFKVVDSDDWLQEDAYRELLDTIEALSWEEHSVDLFVCNYVYDHLYEDKQHTVHYENIFPQRRNCTWNEMGHFYPSQYLVMHALIYRTAVLRRSGVKLPEHTFYVDNIFAYQSLPYVNNIYYLPVDLYHYFIGRDDQSVNEKVMMQRIDQQIRVTKIVTDCSDLHKVQQVYPKLAAYMIRNISIMLTISSIHLLLIGDQEAMDKREDLWNYVKNQDEGLYHYLRRRTLSKWTYIQGKAAASITVAGYRMARKIYKFN